MSIDTVISTINLLCNVAIGAGLFHAWQEYKKLTTVPPMRAATAEELNPPGTDDL